MFYIYRCTTQQLEQSLNRIVDAGDTVVQPVHTGGRDWIIVCRKGQTPAVSAAELEAGYRELARSQDAQRSRAGR